MHHLWCYIRWQRFVWLICRGWGKRQKEIRRKIISQQQTASCQVGETRVLGANPPVGIVPTCLSWFPCFPVGVSTAWELNWFEPLLAFYPKAIFNKVWFFNCTSLIISLITVCKHFVKWYFPYFYFFILWSRRSRCKSSKLGLKNTFN